MECPHCGAEVRREALACPECGSDATTGWSEEKDAWAGEPPSGYGDDEDFDYEAALAREGLGGRKKKVAPSRVVAVALVVAILLWLVLR